MKKLHVLISILMVTILGIANMSWAQQDSVFDDAENWIIRAYIEDTTSLYTVKIELLDTNNPPGLIDIQSRNITGLTSNPETVTTNATNQDISLAFDDITGTTYLLYTDTTGLQLRSYNINSGPRISVTPIAVNFGDKNTGSTYTQTVTVENQGSANLTLGTINVTNTSGAAFSSSGGTCANGQVLAPDASCTVIVAFSPTADMDYTGTLAIPSNDDNVNVALSGHGVVPSGSPDLKITKFYPPSSASKGKAFSASLTIQNSGNASAGSFTVKIYFSTSSTFNGTGQVLGTYYVSSLGAGQSLSFVMSNLMFSDASIHSYYYLYAVVDADYQVTESNEGNNVFKREILVL